MTSSKENMRSACTSRTRPDLALTLKGHICTTLPNTSIPTIARRGNRCTDGSVLRSRRRAPKPARRCYVEFGPRSSPRGGQTRPRVTRRRRPDASRRRDGTRRPRRRTRKTRSRRVGVLRSREAEEGAQGAPVKSFGRIWSPCGGPCRPQGGDLCQGSGPQGPRLAPRRGGPDRPRGRPGGWRATSRPAPRVSSRVAPPRDRTCDAKV
mmetsp:Transcript_43585/g.117085  ORF Transcript_43585/g.117085 Transcript_43585/m.117085 type:complete len:208 (+) Transcript_43585:949-1572(+)